MFNDFDFHVIWRAAPYLFGEGMVFTLTITAIATVGGIALGTVLALARLSGMPGVAQAAAVYVNVFRALPLILVIFLFYFLAPYLGQWITSASRPMQVGARNSAIVTFTLFEAAYFSEIVRSGVQSIPRGQLAAAQALGMRYLQTMAHVVLPQAFRAMAPVLLTQTIVLFQDTSLVYVLSLTDFLGGAAKIAQREGRLVEMYLFAAAVYLAICFTASRVVAHMQARMATPH
ncbi:MAG: amino acid transporter permease [Ramlibacter sp.]|nr:amino acid transporter permease [Ramlibacter sp.]